MEGKIKAADDANTALNLLLLLTVTQNLFT
jgi:hypothetical protein